MAEGFGYPYTVEALWGDVGVHFLGIEFSILDTAASRADGGEFVGIGIGMGIGRPRVVASRSGSTRRLIVCETFCDLDLSATDGDAGHGTAVVAGQMACGAADAAADVEDGAVGAERGDFEKQVDQVGLAGFFGVGG